MSKDPPFLHAGVTNTFFKLNDIGRLNLIQNAVCLVKRVCDVSICEENDMVMSTLELIDSHEINNPLTAILFCRRSQMRGELRMGSILHIINFEVEDTEDGEVNLLGFCGVGNVNAVGFNNCGDGYGYTFWAAEVPEKMRAVRATLKQRIDQTRRLTAAIYGELVREYEILCPHRNVMGTRIKTPTPEKREASLSPRKLRSNASSPARSRFDYEDYRRCWRVLLHHQRGAAHLPRSHWSVVLSRGHINWAQFGDPTGRPAALSCEPSPTNTPAKSAAAASPKKKTAARPAFRPPNRFHRTPRLEARPNGRLYCSTEAYRRQARERKSLEEVTPQLLNSGERASPPRLEKQEQKEELEVLEMPEQQEPLEQQDENMEQEENKEQEQPATPPKLFEETHRKEVVEVEVEVDADEEEVEVEVNDDDEEEEYECEVEDEEEEDLDDSFEY